jgi:hypothetical protein
MLTLRERILVLWDIMVFEVVNGSVFFLFEVFECG